MRWEKKIELLTKRFYIYIYKLIKMFPERITKVIKYMIPKILGSLKNQYLHNTDKKL
jgi:hypothetical protein